MTFRFGSLLFAFALAGSACAAPADDTAVQDTETARVIRTTPDGEPLVQVQNYGKHIAVTMYLDPAYVRSLPGLGGFQPNGAFFARIPKRDPSNGHVSWSDVETVEPTAEQPRPGLSKYLILLSNEGCEGRSCFDPFLDLPLVAQLGVAVHYANTSGDFWLQKAGENFKPAPVACDRATISAEKRGEGVALTTRSNCTTPARRRIHGECDGGTEQFPVVRPFEVVAPQTVGDVVWDPRTIGMQPGGRCRFLVEYTGTKDYSSTAEESDYVAF